MYMPVILSFAFQSQKKTPNRIRMESKNDSNEGTRRIRNFYQRTQKKNKQQSKLK